MKFTEAGFVTIRVRRRDTPWKHLSYFMFEVEDSGVGISEGDLPRIFSPFVQLHDKRNRKTEGSGLGLSIAKRLIEVLSGSFGVTSTLGSGSTFWFEVPLEPLPPNTLFPSLYDLPRDPEALARTVAFFGSVLTIEPPPLPLVIGTNLTGKALDSLTRLSANWGVTFQLISSPQHLKAFLSTGSNTLLLDDAAPFMEILASRSQAPSARPLRVILYSKLTTCSEAIKASASVRLPSKIGVLTKPFEPLKLYRGLLFLIGADDCLRHQVESRAPAASVVTKKAALVDVEIPAISISEIIDVLVVEDNPVNQLILRKMLDKAEVRYRITPSGEEGLEIWKSSLNSIPLIFMDVEVEGSLDGLQVTSMIRAIEKDRELARQEAGFDPLGLSHIAIMTGRAMDSDRQEAITIGCDEFLTKPVSLTNIQRVIENVLKQ